MFLSSLRLLSCGGFKDNRDNRDNFLICFFAEFLHPYLMLSLHRPIKKIVSIVSIVFLKNRKEALLRDNILCFFADN